MGHRETDAEGNPPPVPFLQRGKLIVLRLLAVALFFGALVLPETSHAARTITSATLNGTTSVTVAPSANITAVVNVTTTGSGGAAKWQSTGWRISSSPPGTVTCVNHPNHSSAGTYTETFSITAPASTGTYNAYFIAYNNDSCSSGASSTHTMSSAVVVVSNPVPTTTGISPTSKYAGEAAFTMTVNGTNFMSSSVVRFNGSDRSTTYVSATQLTATIPASDLTTAGTFNITVFNPAPGGGTSNAQTFTVLSNPVPTTTSISPTSKNMGDAGFALTVNGTNFVSTSVVRFDGSDRTTTYVSATQLTATIPASDLAATGTFNITVFNPTPGGGTSNAQTFTVNPGLPTATTNAASGVTSSGATLNGTVSSNGAATTVTFEWGLTTAYGNSITATQSPLAANEVNAAVAAALDSLNCLTTFHYRVVATNSAGTTYGTDQTFTTGTCSAPYGETVCAAARFGSDLGCEANDVNLTNIALASNISSCVSGAPVTLDLSMTVNFGAPDRWDVGIFIANDGKLPTKLPANGGASSCSVDILPTTSPFLDLDGAPEGTTDTCGDGNGSIGGGTGSGVKTMTGVTLPCYASPDSGGKLFVPFVVSWDNQKSPIGSLCTDKRYPVPNTTSKCNAPASTVAIDVVVLPKISKTNGSGIIAPGANTTYTVVILNDSGGKLQDMVFKDPADPVPADLTFNSVTCSPGPGATCPTTNVALMQGTGIVIPSAYLPNNTRLTFTIDATLSSGATLGSHLINKATVTAGGHTNTATDDDLIAIAPSASKSFGPSTIPEGASSALTITLTNPTGDPVTGVAFTDTYPSGLVNTAAANPATTCGGTVTAANNGSSVALSGGTIPAFGSCTATVNVTSATAGSYTNSTGTITTASPSYGTIPAASGTLNVDPPVFGSFNACDVGTSCTNTTTDSTSHITTKIAGAAFSLDLVALNTNGSQNTSYNNTVRVELLDASNNTGQLDSNNCRSSWTVIATLSPDPAFTNVSNGRITVGPFTVANAYREVRVRVTNVGGTTKVGCSTDMFAIRPYNLAVVATDTDWQTTGTTRTLDNTDTTNPGSSTGTPYPIHKAGQPFTLTATAKNASNVTTANYTGSPTSTLTQCGGTACPPLANPGLALGSSASASGVVTWTATYSEVGAFDLTLQDADFTSVDASDTDEGCPTVDYPMRRYVCSAATGVGRFVPDHFDLSGNAIVNRSDVNAGAGCSPASIFTYMGEPMGVSFTLTAKNAGGNTTSNYQGSHAKFSNGAATWTTLGSNDSIGLWMIGTDYTPQAGNTCKVLFSNVSPWTTSYSCTGASPPSIDRTAGRRVTVAAPAGAWSNGVVNYTATVTLERADTPDGPYATVNIGVAPQDADGVTLQSPALNLDADNSGSSERQSLGTTAQRFGILRLENAAGSELLDLRLRMRTNYYSGIGWVRNTDDSCTRIPNARSNISMGNCNGTLNCAAGGNLDPATHLPDTAVTLSSGENTILLTRPTCVAVPCPTGSLDFALALGTAATNNNCVAPALDNASNGAGLPWLQYAWCASKLDPNARATFGTPRSRYIYLRERY